MTGYDWGNAKQTSEVEAGESIRYTDKTGETVAARATATEMADDLKNEISVWGASDIITWAITGDHKLPNILLTPGWMTAPIHFSITVQFQRKDGDWYAYAYGERTRFPNYEIFVRMTYSAPSPLHGPGRSEPGEWLTLYQYDHVKAGTSPLGLLERERFTSGKPEKVP